MTILSIALLGFRQGEVLIDKRHGKGKHMCSNGEEYDGQWHLDKRHGKGKLRLANGAEYDGAFEDDKANG